MPRRNIDPGFDNDAIEDEDPLGEQGFEAEGFEDAPDGGPAFSAPGLEDDLGTRRPRRDGQKMAGIPESQQKIPNNPSEDRPDSEGVIIHERGGESKGDPAVGGTRPD